MDRHRHYAILSLGYYKDLGRFPAQSAQSKGLRKKWNRNGSTLELLYTPASIRLPIWIHSELTLARNALDYLWIKARSLEQGWTRPVGRAPGRP